MADPTRRSSASSRLRRGNHRAATIGRTLTLLALLPVAGRLPVYVRIVAGLIGDPRIPASRKAILAGAFGYALAPVDIVADRFPILGLVDDLVIAALALDTFLAGVPDDVLEEQLDAVGLPRAAFDEDVTRLRRLVPRPLRRLAHRLPAALQLGARVAHDAGLGSRVRGLLNKEGSPA